MEAFLYVDKGYEIPLLLGKMDASVDIYIAFIIKDYVYKRVLFEI